MSYSYKTAQHVAKRKSSVRAATVTATVIIWTMQKKGLKVGRGST